jgi:hypothetical protein
MKRVGVFTSIPPIMKRTVGETDYGPAIREACIQQWILAGYPVFSLNSDSEIECLPSAPKGAKYLSNGTPNDRTSVGTMVKLAVKQKLDVAVFTNADCFLLDIQKMRRVVESIEPLSLCLLERMNIDQETLRSTGQHCAGFDTFVIGSQALELIDRDAPWKIGDTWWDYWFPVSILLSGGRLKTCLAPLLAHLNHPLRWNFESWKENGERFTRKIWASDLSLAGQEFQDFFNRQKMGDLTHERLSAIGDFTFDWLRRTAEPTDSALAGTIEELRERLLLQNAFFSPAASSIALGPESMPTTRRRPIFSKLWTLAGRAGQK